MYQEESEVNVDFHFPFFELSTLCCGVCLCPFIICNTIIAVCYFLCEYIKPNAVQYRVCSILGMCLIMYML